MIDTFKKIGFTDKELYMYKIKDLYTEYYDLEIINENEYCNIVSDKVGIITKINVQTKMLQRH